MHAKRKALCLGPVTLVGLGLALTPTAAHAQAPFSVVMSGLDNPYGLAFGPDGGLYVAEAGTGNDTKGAAPGFVDGAGQQDYFGDTGAVSRLLGGIQTRVLSGLPSLGPAGGGETGGLQGLAFDAAGDLYGAFGLGGTEAQRTQLVADVLSATGAASTNAGDLGQIVRLNPAQGTMTPLSDLVPYETQNYAANNPDKSVPEANPYALMALPGGGFAASDGGGNVVLKAPPGGGAPSLLTLLPAAPNPSGIGGPTYQSVPTALALDSKGTLYVGEFTGVPFPAGGASVFSVNPGTGKTTVFATGFTTITGLAFGKNGALYVLDLTTTGLIGPHSPAQLFQFDPTTGARTLIASLAAGSDYTDLIAGPDNALYLSSQGAGKGAGQVLRFALPAAAPEPSDAAGLGLGVLGLSILALRARKKARAA